MALVSWSTAGRGAPVRGVEPSYVPGLSYFAGTEVVDFPHLFHLTCARLRGNKLRHAAGLASTWSPVPPGQSLGSGPTPGGVQGWGVQLLLLQGVSRPRETTCDQVIPSDPKWISEESKKNSRMTCKGRSSSAPTAAGCRASGP